MWAQDRDELQLNVKQTIWSKKTMVSAYFSRCGFVPVEFLPTGQRHNSHFFPEPVSPGIERKLAKCRPKLRTTVAHLRIDNATPHICNTSIEKIDGLGFLLVPQRACSPDLAPCDFFLFGYLRQHLEGKQLTKEDQVISAVREASDEILLQMFQNVMHDWQYLDWYIRLIK
jgi:hypothetical protein